MHIAQVRRGHSVSAGSIWLKYNETVQDWSNVTVLVYEVMYSEFYESYLSAFEKRLRYRVVKVDYVFWRVQTGTPWCSHASGLEQVLTYQTIVHTH